MIKHEKAGREHLGSLLECFGGVEDDDERGQEVWFSERLVQRAFTEEIYMGKIILMLFLLLPACSNHWVHPTKSTKEFYQDRARCKALARKEGSTQMMPGNSDPGNSWNETGAKTDGVAQTQIFQDCMKGEGWSIK